jgi:hypothetical protein
MTMVIARACGLLLFPLLALAAAACAGSASPRATSSAAGAAATAAATATTAATVDDVISVELRAPPKRVRWVSATLGPTRPTLGILVTNHSGNARADVSNLRAHLEAVREGVSFRCEQDVGSDAGTREPKSLNPGAAFLFERSLDCSLPLAGNYAVRVAVSFGRQQALGGAPRVLRTFTLAVHAPEQLRPKPIDALPGVWGAIGASSLIVGDVGRGGSGRMAVALINGGPTAVAMPRTVQLVLRVYREGSPIPCEDAPIDLSTPSVLEPGGSHREPIEISCLGLGVEGRYEVSARLRLVSEAVVIGIPTGTASEIELGRLQIVMSNDPVRRIIPSPSLLPAPLLSQ